MAKDIAISVKNVNKQFKLPHEKRTSVKSAFVNLFKATTYENQKALDDISFEIKTGEFFAIVGRNGSGKSTLLKLLAGIYSPSSGEVAVKGKLTPFIELGVGFSPELTGRENVFLNGALLGFSRSEMEALYDEIVTFAELDRFMDQKLKNYSSGMQVRLAFSIAIRAKSDILLIDEVLAVGDENFQRKCYEYFSSLKRQNQTVVFVSHDMSAVRDYCTSGVLLNDGKIVASGKIKNIISSYTQLNLSRLETKLDNKKTADKIEKRVGEASIVRVWTSIDSRNKNVFPPNSIIEVNIEVEANKDVQDAVVGVIIQDDQGRVMFATNTNELNVKIAKIRKKQKIVATFSIENIFTNGRYTISCAVANKDRSVVFSRLEEVHSFTVGGWPSTMEHSAVHPGYKINIRAGK